MVELLIFDILILGIPTLFYFFPPASRNALYGYRTPRAYKTEENWKFAQAFFAERWIFIPLIVIISQTIMLLIGMPFSGDPPLVPLVSLGEFLLGSIVCLLLTEKALKDFEESGKTS
ncbi:SdpI family protein [Ascidiimonas sp. W6]|uniref:SdpI family protein n=1 Tax=Ascidiimonas meishanensis TaxID=3128903 RepID=UPI0030EC1026